MFLKRLPVIIFLFISILIFNTGCSQKEITLYGDYCDAYGKTKAAYIKSFLMMDCCEDWSKFIYLANNIPGAGAIEGLEYYIYNEKGEELPITDPLTIIFHPTDDFREKEGRTVAYNMYSRNSYPAEITDNGDIIFKTSESGVFLIVKFSDNDLWISNLPDCNNQCRTCSDEW